MELIGPSSRNISVVHPKKKFQKWHEKKNFFLVIPDSLTKLRIMTAPFGPSAVLLECAGIALMQGDRRLPLPSDINIRAALKSIHVKQIWKQTPRRVIYNLELDTCILITCFKCGI